jgi:hypothetical protein
LKFSCYIYLQTYFKLCWVYANFSIETQTLICVHQSRWNYLIYCYPMTVQIKSLKPLYSWVHNKGITIIWHFCCIWGLSITDQ